MTTNGPDYDALEAVAAAATPGPWRVLKVDARSDIRGTRENTTYDYRGDAIATAGSSEFGACRDSDAELIVSMRNNMADLLARARERDAATAERDRLLDGLGALIDTSDAADADCGSCSQKSSHARQLRTLLDQTANDGNANELER